MPLLVIHINLIINLRVWIVCKFYQIKTNEIAHAVTSNTILFNYCVYEKLKFKKIKIRFMIYGHFTIIAVNSNALIYENWREIRYGSKTHEF